ncbi:MAG: hypothetical protein Q8Q09_18195 [Deltaproteobacteria bacterium]|nr:hypothetical protein [Deltaproteobacteria bacterium]
MTTRPAIARILADMGTDSNTQTCYRCKETRPLAAFTQRVDNQHYNMCRECVSEILAASHLERGPRHRLPHTATERVCYL